MIKKDICLGGASKQNVHFFIKCALKNALMPPMSRIGPVLTNAMFKYVI